MVTVGNNVYLSDNTFPSVRLLGAKILYPCICTTTVLWGTLIIVYYIYNGILLFNLHFNFVFVYFSLHDTNCDAPVHAHVHSHEFVWNDRILIDYVHILFKLLDLTFL